MNSLLKPISASVLLLAAVAFLAGCQKNETFADYYKQQQLEIGNKDPRLIDTMQAHDRTVALGSTANAKGRRFIGVGIYEHTDKGWNKLNGFSCDGGPSRARNADIQIICGTLSERYDPVTQVMVEDKPARLFPKGVDKRVWYNVGPREDVTVRYLDNEGKTVRKIRIK